MRTKLLRFFLGIILTAISLQSYADSKSIKSAHSSKIVNAIQNHLLSSETSLSSLFNERNKEAASIIDNRVKNILDDFSRTNQVTIQGIQNDWTSARRIFLNNLQSFLSTQSSLSRSTINQIKNQSLAGVTGATMASVNFVQFNYGRESIRRSAPQHLRGMSSLLRSNSYAIQGYLAGFSYTEDLAKSVSRTLEQIEENVAIEGDSQSLLSQLSTLQLQADYVTFDSRLEADKARAFMQLLGNLKNFANQNSSNASLQALIRSSEDRKYPSESLANVRSLISSNGTAWLLYAPDIYESVLLTTAFLSELNGKFAEILSTELQRIQSKQQYDQIQFFRTVVNISMQTIPILKQGLQEVVAESDRISALLSSTASQIQNSPSTAGIRFQRLMSDLTILRNSFRSIGEELLEEISILSEALNPKQSALETALSTAGTIRTRFKATGLVIPINFDLVYDFKFFLEDKEPFLFVLAPAYWQKLSQIKITQKSLSQKTVSKINRCILILSEDDLIENKSLRDDKLNKCMKHILSAFDKSDTTGAKSVLSVVKSKIRKLKQKEFIEAFEKDFYGESLINYANTMNLNPEPGEDAPFQEEE